MLVRRSKTEMETNQDIRRYNKVQRPTETFITNSVVVPPSGPHPARLPFKILFFTSSLVFQLRRLPSRIQCRVAICHWFEECVARRAIGNRTSASRQFEPSSTGVTALAASKPNVATEVIENECYTCVQFSSPRSPTVLRQCVMGALARTSIVVI
jgi:hypothetical protein